MAPEFEKIILADGRATLYRADCLEVLSAGLLKCDAIVADPPYGIGFQHSGFAPGNVRSSTETIIGDGVSFDPAPWVAIAPRQREQQINQLRGGSGGLNILLFGADHFKNRLPDGGVFIAWDKHVGHGPDDSFADCEWAWCGKKIKREVFRHLWKGAVAKKNAEDCLPRAGNKGRGAASFQRVHVSQKPVALMRWCIQKLKPPPGGIILDPYMGSGTTGIAALSLGHRFIGVEIDPGHFTTTCKRIEAWWVEHGA